MVLYEACTGQRPFIGDNSAELVSSIMRDAPASITELRPGVPPHLEHLIRNCLEKRVTDRAQSALEVRNRLRSARSEITSAPSIPSQAAQAYMSSSGAPTSVASSSIPRPASRARTLMWGAVIAVVGGALIAALWLMMRGDDQTASPPVVAASDASIAILFPGHRRRGRRVRHRHPR